MSGSIIVQVSTRLQKNEDNVFCGLQFYDSSSTRGPECGTRCHLMKAGRGYMYDLWKTFEDREARSEN